MTKKVEIVKTIPVIGGPLEPDPDVYVMTSERHSQLMAVHLAHRGKPDADQFPEPPPPGTVIKTG